MKFERLLKIYWSRFFVSAGRTLPFDLTLLQLIWSSPGIDVYIHNWLCLRFEWNDTYTKNSNAFNRLPLPEIFDKWGLLMFNKYLSFFLNINAPIYDLIVINLLRKYIVKSFSGRAYLIKKPSHGQRTRSNAHSASIHNSLLVPHINEFKKRLMLQFKSLKRVTYHNGKRIEAKMPKSLKRKLLHVPLSSPHIQKWF